MLLVTSILTGTLGLFEKIVSSQNDFIATMNEKTPPALTKLGARIKAYDATSQTIEMHYSIDDSFCHSGDIIQGGYIAGMLDGAMAHTIFASFERYLVLATLEMSVSYLEIARPGTFVCYARPVRLGKSIAFLEGWLHNTRGITVAKATSTAKIIDKVPRK